MPLVAAGSRARKVREGLPGLVRAFNEHGLLTYASAISFQAVSAIVPFMLFALGLLGFLDLRDVWQNDIAAQIKPKVSPAAYALISRTADKVLITKAVFWVTAGGLLTTWQISGAVRAVMGALNRIYRTEHERPLARRILISLVLAIAVGGCLLLAIVMLSIGPVLHPDVGTGLAALLVFARWAVAGGLLLVAVGLLVRHAPATHQPMRWVSFGSLLVVGFWLAMSVAFGAYLRAAPPYSSLFGSLAFVVLLIAYLYLSSIVFLAGAQVDAMVRTQHDGTPDGE